MLNYGMKTDLSVALAGCGKMSNHNNLNWSDFLLCIGMELAFHKNGERPIQEQMIAEKMMDLGVW